MFKLYIDGKAYDAARTGQSLHGYEAVLIYENGVPTQEHKLPVTWLNDPYGAVRTGGHTYSTKE